MSSGRPEDTTVAAECSVGISGGRPEVTTLASGYSVGMSGGRPQGTTLDRGYNVGTYTNADIDFSGCDFPTHWDTSSTMLNISNDLCTKLKQRVNTQRAFDQQPLTKRICWQCGRVLWGEGSCKGTYPPTGMQEIDAPANAVDNCFLTFEHNSTKRKWYSCAYCKTNQMEAELYVGDVLDTSETMSMKPVKTMGYEKTTTHCSTDMKLVMFHFVDYFPQASVSQYQVNSVTKLDRHFHGMFGFLAVKEDDINVYADNPDSASRIKKALSWYRSHNHLYASFYSNYETLFRYVKPQFGCINPELLAEAMEQILEDEVAGMAFSVDARFFD